VQRISRASSCNHFDITADKGPCVVFEFAGLCLCVCVCINICVCVYNMDLPLKAPKCS
jgi:hypothetical protein